MRLISLDKIKEGDIIARDIISHEGGILLKRSTKFKQVFRDKLIERNIFEIYIEDKFSEGIVPLEVIDVQLRNKITRDVKNQFEQFEKHIDVDYGVLSVISEELIMALSEKDLVCEVMDLKTNDNYTYEHCIGVALLSALVCRKMEIPQEMTQKIVMGALMHDIGKTIIPKDILNKPTRLTEEEYEIIKSHSEIGYKMIKENSTLSPLTKLVVLCHHEREDMSGYPLGKGEELHIGTKIVAACDVFHALLSDRPYRNGLCVNEVVNIARREKINPEIRAVIESTLAFYPIGTIVLLSNGDIGIVEKNFSEDVKRPLVKVIYNEKSYSTQNYRINLQDEKNINIIRKLEDLPIR